MKLIFQKIKRIRQVASHHVSNLIVMKSLLGLRWNNCKKNFTKKKAVNPKAHGFVLIK